jgi:hypothetical protein
MGMEDINEHVAVAAHLLNKARIESVGTELDM